MAGDAGFRHVYLLRLFHPDFWPSIFSRTRSLSPKPSSTRPGGWRSAGLVLNMFVVSKHVGYPLNGFLSWCCHTMPYPIDALDYATNSKKHTHEIAWIAINVDQVHIWIHHTHLWVIFTETCIRKSIMSHTAIGMPLPRGTTIQEKIGDRELI